MTSPTSDSRDEAVRRAWSAGDVNGAITAALAEYGPEIRGWLVGVFPDADDANDVFSVFTERLWATFTRFGWRCSVRTWAYTIARSAAIDHQRGQARRVRRRVPLSSPEAAAQVARARTATPASRKTANRMAIAQLRDQLPTQDRMLLVLRVDRQLAWDDLARVFLEQPDPASSDLKREAARLRKRFQLVKLRLVALARRAGLVESP